MSYRNPRWLIVAATLALSGGTVLAADHAHEHEGRGAIRPTLDHGRKWASDASLRQGMESIKAALQPQLDAIHNDTLKAAQYQTLAQQTNEQISFMVANCKLPPQADAQLHLVLADILAAADTMAGKDKEPSRREGALRLQRALETYGEFFDHPGWEAPQAGH